MCPYLGESTIGGSIVFDFCWDKWPTSNYYWYIGQFENWLTISTVYYCH